MTVTRDGPGPIVIADDRVLRRGFRGAGCLFLVWGSLFAAGPLYWHFRHGAAIDGGMLVFLLPGVAAALAGLLLVLWHNQVRLDAARSHVEVFRGFFGRTRIHRIPLQRFDCVRLSPRVQPFDGQERVFYELNLCGPDCPVISLGGGFKSHAGAVKAGLRAASGCGVAFEDHGDAGGVARIAPEQIARLVLPGAVASKIPWWRRPSVIVLVLANLVPIAGVLYADWKILPLMLLFWLENLVIGLFTIAKMLLARGHEGPPGKDPAVIALGNLVLIAFFVFHYGFFAVGHGMFLVSLFGSANTGLAPAFDPASWATIVKGIVLQHGLALALLALVVSHGVSFYTNYVRQREFEDTVAINLMWAPYKRVVILHVVILVGGLAASAAHATVLPLLLLIALKIIVDLAAHLYEHHSTRTPVSRTMRP